MFEKEQFYCTVMHNKEEVSVGPYKIWVGGCAFIKNGDLEGFDLLIPLAKDELPMLFGKEYRILCAHLYEDLKNEEDLSGIWPDFVQRVIGELSAGKKIFAFCFRGHGRTGLLLSSLVALLETKEESPDPIAAIRQRYCRKAVECIFEARQIFSLRGEKPPEKYMAIAGLMDE